MATVTLEIPDDLAQRLQLRSQKEGGDIAKVAIDILKKELPPPMPSGVPLDQPFDAWREQFESWVRQIPQLNTGFVDDSRETIYEGR